MFVVNFFVSMFIGINFLELGSEILEGGATGYKTAIAVPLQKMAIFVIFIRMDGLMTVKMR